MRTKAHLNDEWHRDLTAPGFQLPNRGLHLLNLQVELQESRCLTQHRICCCYFSVLQTGTAHFLPSAVATFALCACLSPSSWLPCAAEHAQRGWYVPQV
jgi:hypothetical protein